MNAAQPIRPKPTITRLLQVSNEYLTAAAVWVRSDGFWRCTQAAPIIAWMRRTPVDRIPIELLKRGCRWEWISEHKPATAGNAILKSKYGG
jgi:hypothetical protein